MRLCSILGASLVAAACHTPDAESTSSSTSTTTTTGAEDTHGSGVATTAGVSTVDTSGSTTSTTSDATTTGGGEVSTSEGSTSEDASSSSGTTGEVKTCKKVDIVFSVVDNGHLEDARSALVELAPHLAERLGTDFADWDVHLLFANASGTWGYPSCEGKCGGPNACTYDPNPPYPCDYEPSTCDLTLGGGVTYPIDPAQADAPCPIDGDQRYVVSGQEDLEGTLECLLHEGATGTNKYPVVRATLDAIGPQSAPGACNEGFYREDAYLVVVLVVAAPDFESTGTPAEWTQELKSHKGGKFDRIYFVGLYKGCLSPWEYGDFEPLREWTESLYYHTLDDACLGSLIQYIDPALDYVLGDCQE